MPLNQSTLNRIKIHETLNTVKNIVKLIDHFDGPNLIIEPSALTAQYIQYQSQKHIFAFVEYYPAIPISQQTFSQTMINSPSLRSFNVQQKYLTSLQLLRALQVFSDILKTVQKIHQKGIFHFDLKPDNILANQNNFRIIDFGSAQQIQQQYVFPTDVLFDKNTLLAFATEVTQSFAPTRYVLPSEQVNCEKFDVYSLGQVFYQILTNSYLNGSLSPHSRQYHQLIKQYGTPIANLVAMLTHRDSCIRISIEDAIYHPVFDKLKTNVSNVQVRQVSFSPSALSLRHSYEVEDEECEDLQLNPQPLQKSVSLNKYQFEYITKLRRVLYQNSKQYQRSKSLTKVRYVKSIIRTYDDQDSLQLQKCLRKQSFIPPQIIPVSFYSRWGKLLKKQYKIQNDDNIQTDILISLYIRNTELDILQNQVQKEVEMEESDDSEVTVNEKSDENQMFKSICRSSLSMSLNGSRFTITDESYDNKVIIAPLDGFEEWLGLTGTNDACNFVQLDESSEYSL
ncbi:Kinase [Hexamita inflata]|uniref:CAMK CAMKL n=1 Tax=Hexamita inflata TaxID=28002 RepID=A0AA86TKJ1_9EUKA|nr:CAMK CAMKL [Hexamita inflata]